MKLIKHSQYLFALILAFSAALSACVPSEAVRQTQTDEAWQQTKALWTETATIRVTASSTPSATSTPTPTPTATKTATITPTHTITHTPTITPTPTYTFPGVAVNVNAAHCRYGPSKAFLHAADLYEGDQGVVHGRFPYTDWLYVKWDKLHYHCWVSPYVVDVVGDPSVLAFQDLRLQQVGSNMYGPPKEVSAVRNGHQVTISWGRVPMTEDDDRGYLIISWVCQDGAYLWWTAALKDQNTTSYTVTDDNTCGSPSSGVLYTVEKHGFSEPVTIPWP